METDNWEQELFLKEQRVEFWEKHHRMPKLSELIIPYNTEVYT